MMNRRISFGICLVVLAASAEAAPVFTACVIGPLDSLPGCVSGSEPITMRRGESERTAFPRLTGSAFGDLGTSAESTPLGLKAGANSSILGSGTRGDATFAGSGTAAVLYDDFLVSGSGLSFIPGSLNFFLSGSLGPGGFTTGSGGLYADGYAAGGVTVGMTVNGTYVEGGMSAGLSPSGAWNSSYGPLEDLTLPAFFTTPVLSLPVGTPFSVYLELRPFASATAIIKGTAADEFASAGFHMYGSSDFTSTLTFPTMGAVFNLPDGVTVDSASALIVNNRFVGANPPTPGVPEPGSIFLLGMGLLGLAVARRDPKRPFRGLGQKAGALLPAG